MGWAQRNFSQQQREDIARSLFKVENQDGDWLNGLCPFHEDENPSFGYNAVDDVFKCLAVCVDSGDLVDLFCLRKGFERRSREGMRAFKDQYAPGGVNGGERRKTPGMTARNESRAARARDTQNKEIPEQIIETLLPIPDDMMRRLVQKRGWNRQTLEEHGVKLLSHYRRKATPYELFQIKERMRVAIPIRDELGTLRNIRTYYALDVPDDAPAKIMSWAKGHGSAMLFPAASCLQPKRVILCEGEGDCLCALSHGLNAITQTGKPDSWPQSHVAALSGREIIIAYDADQAGQKYAEKAAQNLVKGGCKVRLLEWPDYMGRQSDGTWPKDHGQDLTDFFTKHGKSVSEFMVLLDQAKELGANIQSNTSDVCHMAFFEHGVNGRLSFREKMLADYLIEKNTLLHHDMSGQLYRWDGTCFEQWSVDQLKYEAIKALDNETSAARVNSVASIIMSMVSMPHGRDLNDQHEWVCMQNGMLNLRTLEFKDHSPDMMSTVKLGVKWHGDNPPKPATWYKYLSMTIQTEGPIQQAQEFMGYCMTRDTRFAKALLLLGPGSDGKSKFVTVLRALVGSQNCSAVTLSGLEDQFQRAALFGKMLNVGAEVTTEAVQSEFFKNIVTGDSIQASFKHKDSFEFKPFCKLVYASNKKPRVLDNSDGFFRRILPIVFKRQFLENDPQTDPDLEEKLLAELDGIFAWAVVGLHRLWKQKKFTQCEETTDFMMNYRRYNNPVMAFVQDSCTLDSDSSEDLKELYKSYKAYCSESGNKPLNRENFVEELHTATRKMRESAAIHCHRPRIGGQRPYIVDGIRLNAATGIL